MSFPRKVTPGIDLICTETRPHLLGRALIWPGHFAYILRVYQSLRREFVSLAAGNASLVFISDAILFLRSQHVYLPLEVEFRGKRFIRKGAWRPRYILPCVLYCMEGEFEQIITKIRLSIKYKNNSLRSIFH